MKTIKLSQGRWSWVDDEDFDLVNQFKWSCLQTYWTFYAFRNTNRPDGKKTTQRLHRFLLNAVKSVQVDHIDGNGLNNTRDNLRITTNQQNHFNERKTQGTSSIYKGVGWRIDANKWQCGLVINRRRIYLGLYSDEVEAALKYDEVARQHFGKYAALNFPKPGEQGALR